MVITPKTFILYGPTLVATSWRFQSPDSPSHCSFLTLSLSHSNFSFFILHPSPAVFQSAAWGLVFFTARGLKPRVNFLIKYRLPFCLFPFIFYLILIEYPLFYAPFDHRSFSEGGRDNNIPFRSCGLNKSYSITTGHYISVWLSAEGAEM